MEKIGESARKHLQQVILPFWMNLRDDVYGGFYGYVGQDLAVDKQAEKGCILASRILWFFSEAAMLTDSAQLRDYARHAYDFVRDHAVDRQNGGIFWSLRYDGTPLDTTKHTYNQAFAIYALSAYYRLSGCEEALAQAKALYELIESRCTDSVGYLEAFTADWKPESNEKLSENGVMAEKTMNTLLHVFEGYAGLYQATGDVTVAKSMRRILDIYARKIWSPEQSRQLVFFDKNYRSIIDLYSYGHDIESSWLMDWGTGLLGDETLSAQIAAINGQMAAAVYDHAYSDHSLANECDRGEVNTLRIWWVQAEAVLGFVNQWQKTGEEKYRAAAADIYRFIMDKLTDHRVGGEWFWCLDEQGSAIDGKPIVEPWKCPYHNGRMCFELIRKDPEIYV